MAALRRLKSTPALLGGLAAGVPIGALSEDTARILAVFGHLYLAFLTMCVVPIVVTALVSSLARLFGSGQGGALLVRTAGVFLAALMLVAAVSVTLGLIGRPGAGLTDDARSRMGRVVIESVVSPGQVLDKTASLRALFLGLVPSNVFSALVQGNMLQVLFISIVVGVTLAFNPSSVSGSVISILELVCHVFQQAIAASFYLLPLALLAIMADNVANLGIETLSVMFRFVLLVHAAAGMVLLVSAVAISFALRISLLEQLRALRETLFIAFGTRSSVAAMPALLRALRDDLRLDPGAINLVVPFGILLCRYSMVMIFALALVFRAQLYFLDITLLTAVLIMLAAIVGAVGSAGMPGLVALSMLSVIATPLGLPIGVVLLLLVGTLAVVDPAITVANVYLNGAAAAFIARPTRTRARAPGPAVPERLLQGQSVDTARPAVVTRTPPPPRMVRR